MNAPRAGMIGMGAGLALAVLLSRHAAAPPLFDGIPLPQAPYRYCAPPADLRSGNQPPQSGEAIFPVVNGAPAGGGLQTDDAQLTAFFGVGSLQASASAQTVTVRVEPVCDAPPAPAGQSIKGNVYRISATEQPAGTAVQIAPGHTFHLTLRYPPAAFKELQFYDGSQWQALQTTQAPGGSPFAGATPASLGEFAATAPAGAKGPSIFTGIAQFLEGFGILAFILVFGTIALVQEIRRRRKHP